MIDIKPVKLIHLFFCGGLSLFAIVGLFVNKDKLYLELSAGDSTNKLLGIMAIVMALISVNASKIVFNKMIAKINPEDKAGEKFKAYQTAFLVMAAILEAGALFNVVVFLKTANLYFLIFGALCLTALILNAPTKKKVYSLLQIQD